jgi:hypothetical protein
VFAEGIEIMLVCGEKAEGSSKGSAAIRRRNSDVTMLTASISVTFTQGGGVGPVNTLSVQREKGTWLVTEFKGNAVRG